ncbi:MAG: hypothetical protein EBU80_13065 [Chitinophagia bacterium]|nr:hypothetical protein [Chitinophagia bacterium]
MDILSWFTIPAGLVLLVIGGNYLVKGASSLALRFGIAPLVVGLTVVAYGTSAPELVVSVIAGLEGKDNIAVANNAPLLGMEHDKVVREESYVKDFKPMKLGMIQLKKGKGLLELYSKKLLQPNDLECNLITLRRVTE